MKHEEKITNGKLVCIEIEAEGDRTRKVTLTGDFFLHPEDTIGKIENSLLNLPLDISEDELTALIRKSLAEAQLIGASPDDLARIFKKAVSK